MFKKLLEYNWKLFYRSLSGAKIIVLLLYSLLVGLIFSQVIGSVWVILTVQDADLEHIYKWYTPERGQFILLFFVNSLWLAQFFFTNIRLINLEENRKLLTIGFPAITLSKYLAILAVFHPLNLLFSISWLVILMLQFGSTAYLPLALVIVLSNLFLIFSLKLRVLSVVKNYQKWLLLLALTLLFLAADYINQLFSSFFFNTFENQLTVFNEYLSYLPGGLIAGVHSLVSSPLAYVIAIGLGGSLCYWLHNDHVANTKKALQSQHNQSMGTRPNKTSFFRRWLCTQFGNHAGKYLYYVFSHPYNKIQGFFFVAFPIIYLPFMISDIDDMGSMQFLLLFFFIYAPIGFQLIFLGNMFGYEHRELLKEMQFPIAMSDQLNQRLWGALVLPTSMLVLITITECIILWRYDSNLFSLVLGNILLFESFWGLFLWSTFYQFKKVKWVSFSFTQPVISQSVAVTVSLLMIIFSAVVFIPYQSYEIYKQLVMLVLIIAGGFWISHFINNIKQRFTQHITPHLWNEL